MATDETAILNILRKIIYAPLPQQVKIFLQKMSLTETFSNEQALFMEPTAEKCLRYLLNHHCFLYFNPSNGTYRFHNQFRALLQEYFYGLPPSSQQAIYYRCGQWYSQLQNYAETIRFYYLAGKLELIPPIFGNYGSNFLHWEHRKLIKQCYAACPKLLFADFPLALLHFAQYFYYYKEPEAYQSAYSLFKSYLTKDNPLLEYYHEQFLINIEYQDITKLTTHISKLYLLQSDYGFNKKKSG